MLLAFIAEWNRRNSEGGTVWVNLPPQFKVDSTRRTLFTANGQPTQFTNKAVRETCKGFHLRHAFETEQEEDLRYYSSIQLQYGFSLPHAKAQLWNWLRGHQPLKVARLLLEPERLPQARQVLHASEVRHRRCEAACSECLLSFDTQSAYWRFGFARREALRRLDTALENRTE